MDAVIRRPPDNEAGANVLSASCYFAARSARQLRDWITRTIASYWGGVMRGPIGDEFEKKSASFDSRGNVEWS